MCRVLLAGVIILTMGVSMNLCNQYQGLEYQDYQFNPYKFGYDVEDNNGNRQWRQETRNNPMEVHGSYGFRDKHGVYREVIYIADKNGFRANIKSNEPGMSGAKDSANVKMDTRQVAPVPSTNLYKSQIYL